ncbi:MAG TPA: amidohydrolase family protein [Vicinamibacterales bacterium]|nr:amidohydrolase family protein [Vicinamibacterales bacterium]
MRTLVFLLTALVASSAAAQTASSDCSRSRDLRLVNGKIATMDAKNTTVSEVTIQNGVFTAVGKGTGRLSPCTKTIDLKGRTVVPGLVDNHNHILLLGLRPGFDTRLETAASIADVQAIIKARAKSVPAGGFITAMGGWNSAQFAEKRLPTLAELDAADADHPVIVYQSFTGPAAVNTKAKAFFNGRNSVVSDAGAIAVNAPSVAALNALRSVQTFSDQVRGTMDALAYSASVGVTTNVDMGAFLNPGLPDIQESFTFDGLATFNPFTMYNAIAAIHRDSKVQMPARVRVFFLSMDTRPDVPMLRQRLLNNFKEFGDDMLRLSGVGEFATSWPLFASAQPPTNYQTALEFIAKQGWAFQQHSLSPAEDKLTIDTFEAVNKTTPIADLRWSIAHAPRIDAATIARFKAIGAGIAIHPFTYLAGQPGAGPPVRTIVESGIHTGAGSDSAQISTLNPWLMIYFMVTGKNSSGVAINGDQTIDRMKALRLYTADNGWFLKEENKLGSIEVGKLGDVTVLSADYFDPAKVSDEGIKKLKSALTIVDGRVVHDETK